MFPYDNWWRWYIGGRHAHLIEATEEHLDVFQDPYRSVLKDRAGRMRWALKVRLFFMVLLNLGLIATAAAWVATFVEGMAEIEAGLKQVASIAGAGTLLLTGLWLLATRYLGQLEADMVASMTLGSPGGPPPSERERLKIEALEDDSEPPWRPITDRTRRKEG